MLQVQLTKMDDFKMLVKKEKTVFMKSDKSGNIYFILSRIDATPVLFSFKTKKPIDFSFSFEFGEEKILIDTLIEVKNIIIT